MDDALTDRSEVWAEPTVLAAASDDEEMLRSCRAYETGHRMIAHDDRVDLDVGIPLAPAGDGFGHPPLGTLHRRFAAPARAVK